MMYGALALIVFLLDRVTKIWALYSCAARCQINRYLAFEVGYNRGVTWGLLYSKSTLVFIGVTLVIMAITMGVIWYAYDQYKNNKSIVGEMLVIAGSVSNIIDRFMYGGVIDYIELSYNNWVWPSFNVADMAIVIGIGIMLITHMRKGD